MTAHCPKVALFRRGRRARNGRLVEWPSLDVRTVASLLREYAQRTALRGGNPYRAKAYSRAADSLAALAVPLDVLIAEDRLTEIPGVGEAIADIITKLHKTGTHPSLEKLRKEIPEGVLEMLSVPGLRPEKVLRLYKDLGKGRRSSGSEVVMPEMSGRTGGDTGSFAAWPEGCFTTGYTRNVIMHSSRSGHASPLQTVRNQSACEKIQEISTNRNCMTMDIGDPVSINQRGPAYSSGVSLISSRAPRPWRRRREACASEARPKASSDRPVTA